MQFGTLLFGLQPALSLTLLDLVLFGFELTNLIAQLCVPLFDSLGADRP